MFLFEVFFNKIGFRGINCQIFLENNINDFSISYDESKRRDKE